jgi:WhiB family redox-sensing transcriptional regulator
VALRNDDAWQVRAACRGPQAVVFFPPSTAERKDEKQAREARARAICNDCPVIEPCLEFAVSIREPHGIWGGRTEAERRVLWEE